MNLFFGRQRLLHFKLRPPQHEGSQYFMELLDHVNIFLLQFFVSDLVFLLLVFVFQPVIK